MEENVRQLASNGNPSNMPTDSEFVGKKVHKQSTRAPLSPVPVEHDHPNGVPPLGPRKGVTTKNRTHSNARTISNAASLRSINSLRSTESIHSLDGMDSIFAMTAGDMLYDLAKRNKPVVEGKKPTTSSSEPDMYKWRKQQKMISEYGALTVVGGFRRWYAAVHVRIPCAPEPVNPVLPSALEIQRTLAMGSPWSSTTSLDTKEVSFSDDRRISPSARPSRKLPSSSTSCNVVSSAIVKTLTVVRAPDPGPTKLPYVNSEIGDEPPSPDVDFADDLTTPSISPPVLHRSGFSDDDLPILEVTTAQTLTNLPPSEQRAGLTVANYAAAPRRRTDSTGLLSPSSASGRSSVSSPLSPLAPLRLRAGPPGVPVMYVAVSPSGAPPRLFYKPRRYSEFVQLRSGLQARHPNTRLPSLPGKSKWFQITNLSARRIENRRQGLEDFIQQCQAIPEICRDRLWRRFVDPDHWETGTQDIQNIGKYELGKMIGKGSFSVVRYAELDDLANASPISPITVTGVPAPVDATPSAEQPTRGDSNVSSTSTKDTTCYAVKILDREQLVNANMLDQVEREIEIMRNLGRDENVIQLHEVGRTDKHIYLVMEHSCGGDLCTKIKGTKGLPLEQARRYFQQLILGMYYCFRMGVAHRDLKPSNLLIDGEDRLKIADFGFANWQRRGGRLHARCGSPNYVAPEVLAEDGKALGYDGFAADVWSCGVILFVMLAGDRPFDTETIGTFSSSVRDLLRRMLQPNPARRMALKHIMQHPWVKPGIDTAHLDLIRSIPRVEPDQRQCQDRIHLAFANSTRARATSNVT